MVGVSSNQRKIIVGMDFGTTFSGVAWAKSQDRSISVIQRWPGMSSPQDKSSDKVPTEIVYDVNAPDGLRWGYQIQENTPRHQWFKLDLEFIYDPNALSQRYPHPNNIPTNDHLNAQKLTTDYLRALKKHLVYVLGLQLGESQVNKTKLQFILTVPALWSEAAQEKTLLAAKNAGLEANMPVLMVSEPEAAATYVLQRQQIHNILPGDTFVVCDAGGGTVDLISYTAVKIEPSLEAKEAAPGQLASWDEDTLMGAMEHFDHTVKKQYTSDASDQTWKVPVPGLATNEALSVKKNKMILKSADVKEIIEPVIAKAVQLVLDQIDTTEGVVKAILLVGGFGTSKYLRQRIREAVKYKIEVIQPSYGWSAIVQDAVLKGLAQCNPKYSKLCLTSRIARKHFGTIVSSPFNKRKHLVRKRYFSPFHGELRVKEMQWFIKKGDVVNEDDPSRFHYRKRFLSSGGLPSEVTSSIYCDRTNRPAVIHRDGSVLKLVKLKVKLGDLPEDAFHLEYGKDKKWYNVIDYQVDVTYQSASTKYELIHKEGKRYSSVTAEYA